MLIQCIYRDIYYKANQILNHVVDTDNTWFKHGVRPAGYVTRAARHSAESNRMSETATMLTKTWGHRSLIYTSVKNWLVWWTLRCGNVDSNLIKIITMIWIWVATQLAKGLATMNAWMSAGCQVVREKSEKFQTGQKSGKSQGILLKVREKMNIGKSQGKVRDFHLVQSK